MYRLHMGYIGIMEKKMEATIMGLYGWLSKVWSLFGYPKY